MDKKELRKITKKVYEEYGFEKKGKYYYLDLEDVYICSGFSSMHGITYLAYNFSIKAVHSEDERELNNMFDGYDSFEVQMVFDRSAESYAQVGIRCEMWDEEKYAKKLEELLHYYFDPYKKDAINHIIRSFKEIGFVHKDEIIVLKIKAKQYLGL
ncbi:MAG: hypothetical protein IKC48_04525 [Clostridia bacterium]|nr:hypothetical protein [Clostridia bacterium]